MQASFLLSTLLLGAATAQISFPIRNSAAETNHLASGRTGTETNHNPLASGRVSTGASNTEIRRNILSSDQSSALRSNVEIIRESRDYIAEVTQENFVIDQNSTVETSENRRGRHSGRFVFEEEEEAANEVQPEPQCNQENICTNLPDYPNRVMLKALRRGNRLMKTLIKSMASPSKSAPLAEGAERGRSGDIAFRFGNQEVESNICRTLTRKVTPRGAKNTKGEFMWILNRPEGKEEYIQVVDTTQCQDAGEQCLGGELFGHVTSCKQEYSEHKLLALDTKGQQIVIDTFRFPSCCTCHVNRSFTIE